MLDVTPLCSAVALARMLDVTPLCAVVAGRGVGAVGCKSMHLHTCWMLHHRVPL